MKATKTIDIEYHFRSTYHLANIQSRDVGLPADCPQNTVHFWNSAALAGVFSDKRHLQPRVGFAHRCHPSVLLQIHARVLQLFGAVCADKAVEVPQNLQNE